MWIEAELGCPGTWEVAGSGGPLCRSPWSVELPLVGRRQVEQECASRREVEVLRGPSCGGPVLARLGQAPVRGSGRTDVENGSAVLYIQANHMEESLLGAEIDNPGPQELDWIGALHRGRGEYAGDTIPGLPGFCWPFPGWRMVGDHPQIETAVQPLKSRKVGVE